MTILLFLHTIAQITFIKQFAKAANNSILFVQTTWTDAASDLSNDKFDVFVGGITINVQRAESFKFSQPLVSSYKAAMGRCDDLEKYNNFMDIDDKKNLIIENRGGTNESFALSKLKYANILIINGNLRAIASLNDGILGSTPDIMITYSAEIEYQHSINNKLCKLNVTIDNDISI